jgi:hypothetical protein
VNQILWAMQVFGSLFATDPITNLIRSVGILAFPFSTTVSASVVWELSLNWMSCQIQNAPHRRECGLQRNTCSFDRSITSFGQIIESAVRSK